jgi:polar amino acid transport system substrate-binding protein
MQILRFLAATLTLSMLVSGSVQARNISMLTVEWAPHYGSSLPEKGLTTALVKAAFKAGGHSSQVDFIPWARALKEVEEGKLDVVMGAYFNEERAQKYHYSDRIYSLDLGLIARPGLDVLKYYSSSTGTGTRIYSAIEI